MQNIPSKIFLQVDADGEDLTNVDFKELEVTWSSDKIHDTDIPYIREPKNGGWISVETPPTENSRILTLEEYNNGQFSIEIANYKKEGSKMVFENEQDEQPSILFPSHWQPLPQPSIK